MKSFILVLLSATAIIARNPVLQDKLTIEKRIVGGQVARVHQFPYQVGLEMTKIKNDSSTYVTWCGGSLISDGVVLTAAHCLDQAITALVFLGAHNRDAAEEPDRKSFFIDKSNMIMHENYDTILVEDDIALIILPEKIQLNDKINIVNLPRRNQAANLEGRVGISSGWGKTGDYKPGSDVLRFVNRKILPNRYCSFVYSSIMASQMCVDGANGKSTCQGDSGGPLVISESNRGKTIVGITSYGRSTGCEKGYPTIYTRVTSYLKWINKHTGIIVDL